MPKRLEALPTEIGIQAFPKIKGREFDPESLSQAIEILEELTEEPENEPGTVTKETKED